ncbi:MAG: sulfatase-like hydrolase/transferase [Polaribacter sp.]|uniref:sulfatase-like hydrolase/transferase n=1 Tax=Polaribacter sp. TaxID=1920175 RepID=UPI003BAE194F
MSKIPTLATYLFLTCFVVYSCTKNKQAAAKVATNETINETINPKQPNIITIIIDDAGYADFGFMGSDDLDTPNIDELAKSGVIFTDAHVSATVCAPSRAGLITGKYQQRFGFEANGTGYGTTGDIGLSDDVKTMADVFKANNYKTVAIGKWHLGATESDIPNNRGFDDFYGFLGGGRSYFPIKNPSKELMLQHNGTRVKFDGYLTDVMGDYSVKYIEEHKDTPFFMYLAYNAVHTPMHAKKEHLEKYKNHSRKELAAMTWSLDENIGKLLKKLQGLNILDNTIIYFLSDNGGAANNSSTNGKLKGWKGNEFEGGHRVPFVISWQNRIKPNQTFNGLSSSLDIFSTSLAAANIVSDKNLQLDGVNLLPFLTGEKTGNPHSELYWRKLEEAGMRYNNLKLIRLENYGEVLYDVSSDISETNNLSKTDQESLQLLNKKLTNWETKLMPPLWSEEQEWMDVTFHIHQQLMQNKKALYTKPEKNMKISKTNP